MQRSPRSVFSILAAPAFAVLALASSAAAFNDVVISDGTFATGDWTHSILWSVPTATLGPMSQQSSGGNPGFYQQGHHETIGAFATIYDGHLFTGGASYDPSTQGAITSIDIQYDYIDIVPPTGGTQNGILVSQGGHAYIRPVDSSFWTSWTPHSLLGLLASDSNWSDVSASGVTSGHPDYTSAGGPMQFGYYTFNWSLPQGFDIQRTWGIDNLKITVHGPLATSFCAGDGSLPVGCPCANTGATGHGCNNSAATGGAILTASGTTSPDTVVLTSASELPNVLSIFLQGASPLPQPIAFGDGLRCIGPPLLRLYVKNASGGVVSAPSGGDPSITARSAALGDPIAPGSAREYQVYYRDPNLAFCPPPQGNSWNVSQAVGITW
jgi:hypothetical protein